MRTAHRPEICKLIILPDFFLDGTVKIWEAKAVHRDQPLQILWAIRSPAEGVVDEMVGSKYFVQNSQLALVEGLFKNAVNGGAVLSD